MNEPNLDDLSLLVPGKFTLVTLAMKRARQLQANAQPLIDTTSAKPVTIALQEILASQVRALPMPPTEELEAKEQADLLAAIGLSEPTSVSVARRMEELIYGPEEESDDGEEYEEEYLDEDEDEALGSLGLDEDLEEPAGEREESDLLGEDETPELGADLSLDELDEDGDSDEAEEEEEEEESFSDDFGDALASPRKTAVDLGLSAADDDDGPKPKTRGRKPGSGKVAEGEDASAVDGAAPAPAKRGRKPKAATPEL